MARDRKNVNVDWAAPRSESGTVSMEGAILEVLQDIRQELRGLNETLRCYRVQRMTEDINRIDRRLREHGLLLRKKT